MSDYEIAVYLTKELQSYGENNYSNAFQAKDRAETFIKGAYDQYGYSVNFLDTTDYSPDPPKEGFNESFTTACPCDPFYDCSYNKMCHWFDDWLYCNGFKADDVTIILSKTNHTNGGVNIGGGVCHAQTGKFVCDLPSSYEEYGWDDEDNAMNTVLHEIGHYHMAGTRDEDSDGEQEHDVARLVSRVDWYTITPMDIKGSENDCDETFNNDFTGWEHTWSTCCESNWSN